MLLALGVVALAFNLRPAVVSVGPLLAETSQGLGMSALSAGLLTSLPVIAFGVFGAMAPAAARLVGMHRLTFLALLAVVAGLLARSLASSVPGFLWLSVLALSGMAVANVLLPSLVKLHFPDRTGMFTSLYTTSLAIGLTSASVLTVPLADHYGSWRAGLGFWALTALVAAVPWVLLVHHDMVPRSSRRRISLRQVAGTRLGWAMAMMFGVQSALAYTMFGWFAQIYRDAGFSPTTAGLLLGVIAGLGIPVSIWVPAAAGRVHDQTRLLLGLVACYPVAYLGLAFFPVGGAWLWAGLAGVGAGVFPLVLTLIGLRSRTPGGTAALSAFTQAGGYAVAATGPIAFSALHDATDGWTWPLVALTGAAGVLAWLAPVVGHPGHLEDQLPAAPEGR